MPPSWDATNANPLADLVAAWHAALDQHYEPDVDLISPQEYRHRLRLAHLTDVAQDAVDRHPIAPTGCPAMTITAKRVTIDDLLTTPQALRRAAASLRRDAATARRIGWPSHRLDLIAGQATVDVERRIRMASPDRHTRAIAQAEAAGITAIRDALKANA